MGINQSNGSKSPHFKAILFYLIDDDCIGYNLTLFLSHVTFYNPQTLLENQCFFSSEIDNN